MTCPRWIATCLVLCLAVTGTATADSGPGPDEAKLLELINGERTSRDLSPLRWDSRLARLARVHAADLQAAGRVSHHSTADGADFTQRLSRTSMRTRAAAENVAYDRDVRKAHRGLMRSPGHRANILDSQLTVVGIGIMEDDDGESMIYVVEDFAAPLPNLTEVEAAEAIRRALARARRNAGGAPLEEDRRLSGRLAPSVEALVESDSVKAAKDLDFGPGWLFTYTTMDPASLPAGAAPKAPRARGYAMAVAFRRTRSYPFGTYWVALVLKGAP